MIKEVRHTGIVVNDLQKAVFFWTDLLGFKIEKQAKEYGEHLDKVLGLNDIEVTTVKLSKGNSSLIELLKFHSHPDKVQWGGEPFTTGITHIALTVSDIDNTFNYLKKNKVYFFSSPQYSPDGYAKFVFGRGPENLLIEFVEVL